MQRSAGRPPRSASARVRPLSSSTRWNSRGPSPSCTPVQSDVYGFIRSPVAERGSSCRKTVEVAQLWNDLLDAHRRSRAGRGASCTCARCPPTRPRRRCPSRPRRSSRRETPTRARRNARAGSAARPRPARRDRPRARAAPSARGTGRGSRRGCGGSRAPGCATGARRRAARSARRDRSRARVMPASASARLSPISSVVSDLTLTTSSTRARARSDVTMRLASSGVARPVDVPAGRRRPGARAARDTCRGARSARRLMLAPASRSASHSGTSATTSRARARIVSVARRTLARICGSLQRAPGRLGKASRRPRRLSRRLLAGQDLGQVQRRARRRRAARARRRCAAGTSCRPSTARSAPVASDAAGTCPRASPPRRRRS